MSIPFQGKITQRDLARIFAFASKNKRWYLFIFLPLALVFAWLTYLNYEHAVSLAYVALTVLFVFLATFPFWSPMVSASNTFKTQKDMQGHFEGEINDEEIVLTTVNATQHLKWTVWKKVMRNQEIILLYQGNNCFNFFPRQFFASDEDWQKFQSVVDKKIKAGVLKK